MLFLDGMVCDPSLLLPVRLLLALAVEVLHCRLHGTHATWLRAIETSPGTNVALRLPSLRLLLGILGGVGDMMCERLALHPSLP